MFQDEVEANLTHLIDAHKQTNQTIKFFRYVWNENGRLVLKYPKLREFVRLVSSFALRENPELFKTMLSKKGLINSDFNKPVLEGNYYLQVLRNLDIYAR